MSDEDQVEYTFTFCVLPSVHSPLALKGRVAPGARIAFVLLAETEIELRVAELTAKEVVFVTLLKAAVTFAVPWLTPRTIPMLLPGVPNSATPELSELHVTDVLMS